MTLCTLPPTILESFKTLLPVDWEFFTVLPPAIMTIGTGFYESLTESIEYPGLWS